MRAAGECSSDAGAPLARFSLTLIQYPATYSKLSGALLALLSLSPIFLGVAYTAIIFVRRDLQTASLAVGQLVDQALNHVLKEAVAQARPAGFCPNESHGMPSNHAQFMAFFATAASLLVWTQVVPQGAKQGARCKQRPLPRLRRIGKTAALVAWTVAVAASRVVLTCHTPEQVAAGAAIGLLTGACWYRFHVGVLVPVVIPRLLTLPLLRSLGVKDYSGVADVLETEYLSAHGTPCCCADK